MKIQFEDGGYLEFQRSRKPHHVHVLVASRKEGEHLKLSVNSAEIHVSKTARVRTIRLRPNIFRRNTK